MQDSTPRGIEGTAALGHFLGLIVHDLRNPVATVSANLSFLQETGLSFPDEDAREAFEDLRLAADEMQRGLEQVGWVVRWLLREPAVAVSPGEVGRACRSAAEAYPRLQVHLELEDPSLATRRVPGGGRGLEVLLGLLLSNVLRHDPARAVTLRVHEVPEGGVRIDVHDTGPRLPAEAAEAAFTPEGQYTIKHLGASGRYGRYLELLAARAVADTLGAELTAGSDPDGPAFRLTLRPG